MKAFSSGNGILDFLAFVAPAASRRATVFQFAATLVFGLCFILFSFAPGAQAASSTVRIPGGGTIQIRADNLNRDFDLRTVVLDGNVKLIYDQQYISCDRAVIDENTLTIEAIGNLVISSLQAYVEGDRATLNYRDNTGVIENGFVKSGQVIFEGEVVRKTGANTYDAQNSSFTACTTCPAAWTFLGSRMRAEIGGYAHIQNPVLRVGKMPVLYLPYLIVPLKSERQSGLLVPFMDFTNGDNVVLGFPFFWAISRSQDATLTLKSYSKRGQKGHLNYRYLLSDTSSGELNTALLNDVQFPREPAFNGQNIGSKQLRWFINYEHKYDLPFDIAQKLKLSLVSDLFYLRDFYDELPGRGDPALENRFSLTKNTERTHASVDAAYYINLLKSDPLADNDDAVHRWPELRYALTERPLFGTPLLFNLNTNYVNFSRDQLAWDDVTPSSGTFRDETNYDRTRTGPGGGRFDPTIDLIRTGQRFDLTPEISYPFKIGRVIDVLPTLQYRFTQYAFNLAPSNPDQAFEATPQRSFARGRISARTRFHRIYGDQDAIPAPIEPRVSTTSWVDAESRAQEAGAQVAPANRPSLFRHEIEPEIIGTSTPFISQPNHPFFQSTSQVPSFLDAEPISNSSFFGTAAGAGLSGIQFDYFDRLSNYQAVTLAITNRLVRKRWLSGSPEYRQIASHRLSASYDFAEASRDQAPRYPISDISSLFDLRLDNVEMTSLVRFFPYHQVAKSSSRLRLKNEDARNYFEVGFDQDFRITRERAETREESKIITFGVGYGARYYTVLGSVNFDPRQSERKWYEAQSYSTDISLRPPGNCWGLIIHGERLVGGGGNFKLSLDYNFGGESG